MRLILLFMLICPFWVVAQEGPPEKPVGFVIIGTGKVTAKNNRDEQERSLARRSKLFSGDEISTGPQAKVQIKFVDGSIIALSQDSVLKIDEFEFGQDAEQEKSFFTLIKGGVRAISGAIGKNRQEDYQMNTPLATIGIRGTHYTASVGQELLIGVWAGGVKVSNKGGEILLGSDADFRFARVDSELSIPQGLLKAPQQLLDTFGQEENNNESEIKQQEERQEERQEDQNAAPVKDKQSEPEPVPGREFDESNNPQPEPETSDLTGAHNLLTKTVKVFANKKTEREKLAQNLINELSTDDFLVFPKECANGSKVQDALECFNKLLDPDGDSVPLVGDDPGDNGDFVQQEDLPGEDTTSDSNEPSPPTLALSDLVQIDRVGAAFIASGEDQGLTGASGGQLAFLGGLATPEPLIVGRDENAAEDASLLNSVQWILRKGSAVQEEIALASQQSLPASAAVGLWRGDAANPVQLFGQNDEVTQIRNSVYWMTALPLEAALSQTGTLNFNIPQFWVGEGSNGPIFDFHMSMQLDFQNMKVSSGVMNYKTGSGIDEPYLEWNITFQGQLSDLLELEVASASVDDQAAEGGVLGLFLETQVIGGGFKFWQISDPSVFSTGLYALGAHDLRLSDAENEQLYGSKEPTRGFWAIDGITGYTLQDQFSNEVAVFEGVAFREYDSLNQLAKVVLVDEMVAPYGSVFRSNHASVQIKGAQVIGNQQVDWGAWNADSANTAQAFKELNNPDSATDIDRTIYWVAGEPTASETIALKTGTIAYNPVDVLGAINGEAITDFSDSAFSVDFNANIISGDFIVNSANYNHFMQFSGAALSGNRFSVTSAVSNTINDQTVIQNTFKGQFIGDNAQGLVGSWKSSTSGGTHHSSGIFVFKE